VSRLWGSTHCQTYTPQPKMGIIYVITGDASRTVSNFPLNIYAIITSLLRNYTESAHNTSNEQLQTNSENETQSILNSSAPSLRCGNETGNRNKKIFKKVAWSETTQINTLTVTRHGQLKISNYIGITSKHVHESVPYIRILE
jgi:NAD+--asparagine ADP-ribosyltransferase